MRIGVQPIHLCVAAVFLLFAAPAAAADAASASLNVSLISAKNISSRSTGKKPTRSMPSYRTANQLK